MRWLHDENTQISSTILDHFIRSTLPSLSKAWWMAALMWLHVYICASQLSVYAFPCIYSSFQASPSCCQSSCFFSPLFHRYTCCRSHCSAPGSFAAFIPSPPAVLGIIFIHIFIPLILILCWYQTGILLYSGTSWVSWRGSFLPLILTKSRWLWLGRMTEWIPFVCGCSVAA